MKTYAPGSTSGAERHSRSDVAVQRFLTGGHRHQAAFVHRFGRVDDQVQHDLPNLRRVGVNQRQRARDSL